MPTLFISYKRDDRVAVKAIVDRLKKQFCYRIWIDAESIAGGSDWRKEIQLGIDQAGAVLLMLTPDSCASSAVKEEVDYAKSIGRVIIPLQIKAVSTADMDKLGVSHLDYVSFVTSHDDTAAWDKLLDTLRKHNQPTSPHDRRAQRDRNNAQYVLHQQYLRRLVERIGTLNLAQIGSLSAGGVDLEQVYVDSPTPLYLSVEVKDWQVIDWWLSTGEMRARMPFGLMAEVPESARIRPESLGYQAEPLNAVISQIDAQIAAYRAEHPNETPTNANSRWRNNPHHDVLNLHLNHLAAARDRLVILGAPGSGKSTFVRYLALCLAGAAIDGWTRPVSLASLDNWPHGALTPIYIELRRFVASAHYPPDVKAPATADHLWNYIVADLLGESLQAYNKDLQYDLEHGHALLILDGLDEVPYPEGQLKARQAQLSGLADSLNTRYAGSRVVVASRPYAYEDWKLPGFESVTITAFEDQHRLHLATRLYQAAGLNADEAKTKAKALNQQLKSIDPELKDRPLFVTLMASIFLKGQGEGLPTRRGALYRESILLLLDRWTTGKAGAPSLVEILGGNTPDDLLSRLAALAHEVQATYGDQPGTPEIAEALLYKHLKPLGRSVAAELIPYLSENAGVLVSPGQNADRDVFHFAHRTFQEYLAGVQLVSDCTADSYEPIRAAIKTKPALWRIPCTLAGDVLADTNHFADLWNLLDSLLDGESAELADDPGWWGLWLAATIAVEQNLYSIDKAILKTGPKAVRQKLIDWLVKLIETPQALLPPERAACGRALGLLGDPRPGVGLLPPLQRPDSRMASSLQQLRGAPERGQGGEVLRLPDIAWADPIPAGSYWIGSTKHDDRNPRRQITIDQPFYVAKYLVTQAQYLAFQNDTGERGYTYAEWWEGLAATDRNKQPAQPAFPYANHPMERVNWYQAVAFSRWLTAQYREAGLIAPDETIRLPHETEWEVAARGADERTYSYPGEFGPAKANTDETGIGQTSAVGLFPDGVSPCRALDMTGNLWEWCLNRLEDGSSDLGGTDPRVVRGGSWSDGPDFARAAYRGFGNPLDWYNDQGFRVVLAAPIPSAH